MMPAAFDQWANRDWHRLPRDVRDRGCEWLRAHDVDPDETRGVTFNGEGAAIQWRLDRQAIRITGRVCMTPVRFTPRTPPPWVLP